MSALNKKIYGFKIWEIGLGAFLLFNIKTIFSLFGLVSKPITNAVNEVVDKQAENTLGLSKSMVSFCAELSPQIKVHLDKTFVDEEALCKLLGNTLTSLPFWESLQKYYNYKYAVDLKSEIYSVLNGWDDKFWGTKDNYKKLLKRSFLIADLF